MKTHKRMLLALAMTVAAVATTTATDPSDLTLAENIATPAVPDKGHNAIVRHIERIGTTFARQGIDVRYLRRGQVACITIPASTLFAANQTDLLPTAPRTLNAFQALLKLPRLYKILVVVHADDTGSAEYSDQLTEDRADAIDEYFQRTLPGVELNTVPYGMGLDEPRAANTSIAGRAANRRIEFYIVPEKQTVDMAVGGKL